MLTEDKRNQLDQIVTDMLKNKESDGNVQFVVDDFKKKYDVPESIPVPTQQKNKKIGVGDVLKFAGNVGLGAVKEVGGTLSSVPQNVARVTEAVIQGKEGSAPTESMGQLAQLNVRLQQELRNIPEDDPRRQLVEETIQKNQSTLDMITSGTKEREERLSKFTDRPESLEPEGTAQKIGSGAAKLAEFIAPGGLIKKGEQLLAGAPKIAQIAGGVGLEAASAAGITAAQGGEEEDISHAALIGGLLSVPFKAVGILKGGVSETLKEGAKKNIAKALRPTTRINKEITDKLSTQLLKKNVVFGSLKGLESRAASEITKAGENLDEAYKALPPNTKASITPIMKDLVDLEKQFFVKGTNQVPSAALPRLKALQSIQSEILALGNKQNNVSLESIRSFRQILDKTTEGVGKGFGMTGKEQAKLYAVKAGANAIRNELAQQFPNLAKLNSEYSFWKNVETITSATLERTQGHVGGLKESITGAGGAAVGAAVGGIPGAALGHEVFRLMSKYINSPGWNSVSGVLKNKLADALVSQNKGAFNTVLKEIGAGLRRSGFDLSPEE